MQLQPNQTSHTKKLEGYSEPEMMNIAWIIFIGVLIAGDHLPMPLVLIAFIAFGVSILRQTIHYARNFALHHEQVKGLMFIGGAWVGWLAYGWSQHKYFLKGFLQIIG